MKRKVTILGSSGFIGSKLLAALTSAQTEFFLPKRDESFQAEHLGVVFCCVGMTANFREDLSGTFDANFAYIKRVLTSNTYDKCIFLSSSRLYSRIQGVSTVTETSHIPVVASDPSDVYTISKLAAESFVLQHQANNVVLRISNIISEKTEMKNFVGQVIREIESTGHLNLQTSLDSCKDYLSIQTLVQSMQYFMHDDTSGIYNISSGYNISNRQLIDFLQNYLTFDFTVAQDAKVDRQPVISNQKLIALTQATPPKADEVLATLFSKHTHKQAFTTEV